jgi:hypothetical protein
VNPESKIFRNVIASDRLNAEGLLVAILTELGRFASSKFNTQSCQTDAPKETLEQKLQSLDTGMLEE